MRREGLVFARENLSLVGGSHPGQQDLPHPRAMQREALPDGGIKLDPEPLGGLHLVQIVV